MSKETMKLALGKIKSARDCHPNAVNTLLFEAEEILEEARAKPDFWEGYVPEPVKPAQQEFVSPGGGYVPAIPAQQALDKKAENARELGLDYKPAQKPVAWTSWRELAGARHYRTPGWEMYADKRNPDDVALYTSPPAPVQDNPLDCGVYLGSGKRHEIKHHVSYGPEPIDTLIAAWQALEETSGHVLDEGDVEGRMHMSVIRSAWEQMDSLVRDLWDERGCK